MRTPCFSLLLSFFQKDCRLIWCQLQSEVENAVKSLVSTAIIDPNVKGGVRWPLGKESIGERFSIVGVWHTDYKAFRNETMRLKLRHADRFDHRTSTGGVSDEVTFKLTAISCKLEVSEIYLKDCCVLLFCSYLLLGYTFHICLFMWILLVPTFRRLSISSPHLQNQLFNASTLQNLTNNLRNSFSWRF